MKRFLLRSAATALLMATAASMAGAGTIPSYTITDLASAASVNGSQPFTLSDTGAGGTMTLSNGTMYAFPRTDNILPNPQSILNTLPYAPVNNPMTGGTAGSVTSNFDTSNVFMNGAGQIVATDVYGINGQSAGAGSTVYTATQQANGAFGPLTALWSTPNNLVTGGQVARVLDLNNSGMVLGVDSGNNSFSGSRDFFLYNLNTGVRTELSSLLPSGWTMNFPPLALDDQGRILLTAFNPQGANGGYSDLLLLTPYGLASPPLATPEPSTFVILSVAAAGFLARRRWKKGADRCVGSKA